MSEHHLFAFAFVLPRSDAADSFCASSAFSIRIGGANDVDDLEDPLTATHA